MHRGYIAIWRKIQDHKFYRERRKYSKLEAWLDLLMEAQHQEEPQQVVLGMKVLIQGYGECLKSMKTWSKRWGWSIMKVKRFLNLLQNMKQICYKNEKVTTRITILNYDKYDPRKALSVMQTRRKRDDIEKDARTNNNDKNNNTKEQEPFGLPDRVKEETVKMCDFLYDNKVFLKAHTFANTMRKKKKNEKAILHTLIRCRQKANREPFPDDKAAWAYCMKIIQVEDGNYNEQDHRASHAKETIDPRRQDTYEDERKPTAIGKIIENTINKQKR